MNKKIKNVEEPVSLEAMERLLSIMNNASKKIKIADSEYEIKPLKNGTIWLIACEALKLKKIDKANTENILLNMAESLPIMIRVITLAILNDKEKIEGKEYNELYSLIKWKANHRDFDKIFLEILSMMDMQFFFATTKQVEIFLQNAAQRKMTTDEVK